MGAAFTHRATITLSRDACGKPGARGELSTINLSQAERSLCPARRRQPAISLSRNPIVKNL